MRTYTRPDGKVVLVLSDGVEIVYDTAEEAMRAMRRHTFIVATRALLNRLWAIAVELDNARRVYEAGYDAGSPEAIRNVDLGPHGLSRAQFDAALAAVGGVADDVLTTRRDAIWPLTGQ